jgi:hypothetical protein
MNLTTDRRSFLAYFSSLGLTSTLFPGVLWGKLLKRASLRHKENHLNHLRRN